VGAPIAPIEREDIEESVVATTALYTRHIEAAIRKHPEQWNWLGLPRRGGKMSRAEIARARQAGDKHANATTPPERMGSRTSSV